MCLETPVSGQLDEAKGRFVLSDYDIQIGARVLVYLDHSVGHSVLYACDRVPISDTGISQCLADVGQPEASDRSDSIAIGFPCDLRRKSVRVRRVQIQRQPVPFCPGMAALMKH